MAASRSYLSRAANRRFLTTDQGVATESMIFELDESDVWSTAAAAARSESPEMRKSSTRISRKPASAISVGCGRPASLPVNVPDWSKILKDEYRENRRQESDDDDYEEDDDVASGGRVPPHEFLARQMARTRMASFSVHEGIGRTLKGRDLSRVRNAVWQKIGFED